MLSEVVFMKGSYFKCPWALCFALFFGQLGLAERQVERPNILFVFGEDWGMDTGAYGNTVVSTPVFDRLAEEGVLFTHAFATAPSCSPSKASVLTGQMHWRLGASVSHSNEVESMLNVRYRTYADALLGAIFCGSIADRARPFLSACARSAQEILSKPIFVLRFL